MIKIVKIIALTVAVVWLPSCKKCYQCEKHDYCFECASEAAGTYTYCSNNEMERDEKIEAIIANGAEEGHTYTCTRLEPKLIPGYDIETCETSKHIDDEVEEWEALGYKCTSK